MQQYILLVVNLCQSYLDSFSGFFLQLNALQSNPFFRDGVTVQIETASLKCCGTEPEHFRIQSLSGGLKVKMLDPVISVERNIGIVRLLRHLWRTWADEIGIIGVKRRRRSSCTCWWLRRGWRGWGWSLGRIKKTLDVVGGHNHIFDLNVGKIYLYIY